MGQGTVDAGGGTHVVADHADISRQAMTGHFATRKHFDELFFTAGGIDGGYFLDLDILDALVFKHLPERGTGLRFIIFDSDEHACDAEDMANDACAFDDFFGTFAHQAVIAGDIGFAFRTVDDQGVDVLSGGWVQFDGSGECGTTQSYDACIANPLSDIRWIHVEIGFHRCRHRRPPAVLAVRLNDDTGTAQTRGVGQSMFSDLGDGA